MNGDARLLIRLCGSLLLVLGACTAQAMDWLPVSAEELVMKSEPLAPRAPAIYLYRQVDRDDNESTVRIYNRIKILTEEGRDYANLKIAYDKNREHVHGIEARTIRPDGSIVEFSGKPYDQILAKGQGENLSAKLLTLTDVQVGSIIEYRYWLSLDERYVFDSNWVLNEELFTKRAKFSLQPNQYFSLRWIWPLGLPPDTKAPENSHGKIRMETSNVAAFVEEEHMPPESAVKMRVEFIYLEGDAVEKEPEKFWKRYGKKFYGKFDDFTDYQSALKTTVASIISADDSEEAKARKLYEWVQKLRNLSFERGKSGEEIKREDLDPNHNIKDVLKHGYGSGDEINWLYVALARAAGLQAYAIRIASRDNYFFEPATMNPNQLNTYVVQLTIGGADVFTDPGTAFAPFGVLPWNETIVKGLRLDQGGSTWILTAAPKQSQVERHATLQLSPSGTIEGKLQVTFSGLNALLLRLNNRFNDATERKEVLENLVKSYVPVGIEVKLTNSPDWSSSALTLVAEFDLKVLGWMQSAGSRGLFPAVLFGDETRHEFDHASRQHPIYFWYPYAFEDDVTVTLPTGWHAGTLPPTQDENLKKLSYSMKAEEQGGSLHLQRKLAQGHVLLDTASYSSLRDFFQKVRDGDAQQIILTPATRTATSH